MQAPLLTEVPSSLKQLARLVVRGFYDIEYSLIVDMLVRWRCTIPLLCLTCCYSRFPCMREDDLCDLLRFDKKVLRWAMTNFCLGMHLKLWIWSSDLDSTGQSWQPWRRTSSCKWSWKLKQGRMGKLTGCTATSSIIRQVKVRKA